MAVANSNSEIDQYIVLRQEEMLCTEQFEPLTDPYYWGDKDIVYERYVFISLKD